MPVLAVLLSYQFFCDVPSRVRKTFTPPFLRINPSFFHEVNFDMKPTFVLIITILIGVVFLAPGEVRAQGRRKVSDPGVSTLWLSPNAGTPDITIPSDTNAPFTLNRRACVPDRAVIYCGERCTFFPDSEQLAALKDRESSDSRDPEQDPITPAF